MDLEKIINKDTLTINKLNEIFSHFDQFFIFKHDGYNWTVNRNIFKIFFLNYDNRQYINEFKKFYNNKYKTEYDIKYNLLIFLLESNFIEIDDIIIEKPKKKIIKKEIKNKKIKEKWTLTKYLLG